MKRAWTVSGVLIVLMVLATACGGPAPITFPDKNLGAAIREALGKSPGEEITAAECSGLTELKALHSGSADLSGLEYCTNLTTLILYGNQITDLSPLANLTNLTSLRVTLNQISDISPLANLTNLTYLRLGKNQISDISPLANLTNLLKLQLQQNQISDISPLVENSGLAAGDEVWLQDNSLDLSEGSEDPEHIRQLEVRGARVRMY